MRVAWCKSGTVESAVDSVSVSSAAVGFFWCLTLRSAQHSPVLVIACACVWTINTVLKIIEHSLDDLKLKMYTLLC